MKDEEDKALPEESYEQSEVKKSEFFVNQNSQVESLNSSAYFDYRGGRRDTRDHKRPHRGPLEQGIENYGVGGITKAKKRGKSLEQVSGSGSKRNRHTRDDCFRIDIHNIKRRSILQKIIISRIFEFLLTD